MRRFSDRSGWHVFQGLLLWVIFGLFVVSPASARSEKISDLEVDIQADTIIVSASLSDALPDSVGEEIQSGIRKELYYYVLLKRRVPLWIDEELASATVRFSIRYDLISKQFVVLHRQAGTTTAHTVAQFNDARRLISKIRDVTIPLVPSPRRRDIYYTSVKAEMRSSKLPVYIEYFLFFLPVAQLTTPWANSPSFSSHPTDGR